MGNGCGPNLELELSQARSNLAATTVTCPDGSQQALFGGGRNNISSSNIVDTFDGSNNLARTVNNLSVARDTLGATNLHCNNVSYALFAGGETNTATANDIDIFICNDDGLLPYTPLVPLELSVARKLLAATSLHCNDIDYALFAGGTNDTSNEVNTVDVFFCNDAGVFPYTPIVPLELSVARERLAATSLHCNDKGYALFAGGSNVTSVLDTVDVFFCNDAGVFPYTPIVPLQLSVARNRLAATSVHCNDKGYALFAGGVNDDVLKSDVNTVDVFICNDTGVFPSQTLNLSEARSDLAATSVTSPDGKKYAVFGGGGSGATPTNVVDVFHCNDDGVFFTKATTFNGPARSQLAATSVSCLDIDYGLFGGGVRAIPLTRYNNIDIFDSSTLEIL